jgi:hypothetical protein
VRRALPILLPLLLAACGEHEVAPVAPVTPATPVTPAPPDAGPSTPAPASGLLARFREDPIVTSVLSAGVRQTLERAEVLEVAGVDPDAWRAYGYQGLMDPEAKSKALAAFARGEGVTRRGRIERAAERDEGLGLLYRSLVETRPPAACFDPRHVLVARAGTDSAVLLFCFACSYVVVLDEGGAGRFGLGDDGLQAWLDAPR